MPDLGYWGDGQIDPRSEDSTVELACINHPHLRWTTKNIGYIGARTLFFQGSASGPNEHLLNSWREFYSPEGKGETLEGEEREERAQDMARYSMRETAGTLSFVLSEIRKGKEGVYPTQAELINACEYVAEMTKRGIEPECECPIRDLRLARLVEAELADIANSL